MKDLTVKERNLTTLKKIVITMCAIMAFVVVMVVVTSDGKTSEATTTTKAETTRTTFRGQNPTYRINGDRVPEMSWLVYQDTLKSLGKSAVADSVAMILTDFDASCADYSEMLYNASTLTNETARDYIERALRWHPLSVGYAWEMGRTDGPC